MLSLALWRHVPSNTRLEEGSDMRTWLDCGHHCLHSMTDVAWAAPETRSPTAHGPMALGHLSDRSVAIRARRSTLGSHARRAAALVAAPLPKSSLATRCARGPTWEGRSAARTTTLAAVTAPAIDPRERTAGSWWSALRTTRADRLAESISRAILRGVARRRGTYWIVRSTVLSPIPIPAAYVPSDVDLPTR